MAKKLTGVQYQEHFPITTQLLDQVTYFDDPKNSARMIIEGTILSDVEPVFGTPPLVALREGPDWDVCKRFIKETYNARISVNYARNHLLFKIRSSAYKDEVEAIDSNELAETLYWMEEQAIAIYQDAMNEVSPGVSVLQEKLKKEVQLARARNYKTLKPVAEIKSIKERYQGRN